MIFSALALGIVLAGLLFYRAQEQHHRKIVEDRLAAIAELKISELVQWRKERMGDASVYHGNFNFSGLIQRYLENPDDADARDRLRTWLAKLQAAHRYESVFLLDPQCEPRMSVPESASNRVSFLEGAVAGVFLSGETAFMDFHRHAPGEAIHLSILVPIFDVTEERRPLGVLVLRIDPHQYLYPMIRLWPGPSDTAETLLVRREGDEAVFLNELRFATNTALNLRFPLEHTKLPAVKAVLGEQGLVEGLDYRGVPVLACVRAVPDSPWFMVARVDRSEIYAPLRQRLWLLIGAVGALLVATGTILGSLWRRQLALYYKERLEAAEALRESEEGNRKQAEMLRDAPVIAALHDLDHNILWVNRAYEQATGLSLKDIVGKKCYEVWRLPKPCRGCPVFTAIESDKACEAELTPQNQDHWPESQGYWLSRAAPVHDADGKVIGAIEMAFDIADRKRAEEEIRRLNTELEQRVKLRTAQLQASNQELESFAYSVSHDLRSPLRAIDGFSRIVLEDYAGTLDPEALRLLNVVRSNTLHMDHLITDLLTLSRATRAEIKMTRNDMTGLVREVYPEVLPPGPAARFEFVLPDLPGARGDPALLRQVWFNLLHNAVKYTSPCDVRRIEVGGRRENGEIVYFVKDSGVGFDPRYTHKLFGAFQRLHKASEFEGTGIGLAIVQRIIHRHGGRVWAEGKVNGGAAFYFALHE